MFSQQKQISVIADTPMDKRCRRSKHVGWAKLAMLTRLPMFFTFSGERNKMTVTKSVFYAQAAGPVASRHT
jgi:hypothetical protein